MLPGLHADPGDIYILLLFYKLKQENMKKILLSALAVILSSTAFAQTEVSVGIQRPSFDSGDGSKIYDEYGSAYFSSEADMAKSADGLTATFFVTDELAATLAKDDAGALTKGRVFLRGVEYNLDWVWKMQCTNFAKDDSYVKGSENYSFGFDLNVAEGTKFNVSAIDMDLLVEQNVAWRIRIVDAANTELYNSNWATLTGGYNQVQWGVGSYAHITSSAATFTWGTNDECLQYYPVFAEGVNSLLPADLVLAAGTYKVYCDAYYQNNNAKSFSVDHLTLEGTVESEGPKTFDGVGIQRPSFDPGDGSKVYDEYGTAYFSSEADLSKTVDGITTTFFVTDELAATLAKDDAGALTKGRVFLRGVEYNLDWVWKMQCTNFAKDDSYVKGSENYSFGFDLNVAEGTKFNVSAIDMDLLVEQNVAWRIRIVDAANTELYNSNWATLTGGYNQVQWGVGSYAHITSSAATFTWGTNDECLQYYPVFAEGVNSLLPADLVLAAGTYKVYCDVYYQNNNAKSFSFDHLLLEVEATDPAGIDGVITDNVVAPVNSAIYSIDGRMIGTNKANLVKGIYIQNGKKFVVK